VTDRMSPEQSAARVLLLVAAGPGSEAAGWASPPAETVSTAYSSLHLTAGDRQDQAAR